jgi:hypothetical protein
MRTTQANIPPLTEGGEIDWSAINWNFIVLSCSLLIVVSSLFPSGLALLRSERYHGCKPCSPSRNPKPHMHVQAGRHAGSFHSPRVTSNRPNNRPHRETLIVSGQCRAQEMRLATCRTRNHRNISNQILPGS